MEDKNSIKFKSQIYAATRAQYNNCFYIQSRHTCAVMSISRVSFFAGAVVPSTGVVADGIQVAFVRIFIALINI